MNRTYFFALIALLSAGCDSERNNKADLLEQRLEKLEAENRELREANKPKSRPEPIVSYAVDSVAVAEPEHESPRRKRYNAADIWQDVKLNAHYNYIELGGISNVVVTVNNPTPVKLKYVKAAVMYLKANGGLYKTEYVYFYNLKPYSQDTQIAPDSDRGIRVSVALENLDSPEF
ncbi:hypothetical protein [Tellurirhabdus rosea]|uniref:hypothetical protein n=1 Tax=Tellurirhabdus rosea TaxID=2674997 RepID=UPI00225B987B|nr:hypothetical protein [Tellurirhabdus rosea]